MLKIAKKWIFQIKWHLWGAQEWYKVSMKDKSFTFNSVSILQAPEHQHCVQMKSWLDTDHQITRIKYMEGRMLEKWVEAAGQGQLCPAESTTTLRSAQWQSHNCSGKKEMLLLPFIRTIISADGEISRIFSGLLCRLLRQTAQIKLCFGKSSGCSTVMGFRVFMEGNNLRLWCGFCWGICHFPAPDEVSQCLGLLPWDTTWIPGFLCGIPGVLRLEQTELPSAGIFVQGSD